MTRYRYCANTAIDSGEPRHPQQVMGELFASVTDAEPYPVADCWIFVADGLRGELPAFLSVVMNWCPVTVSKPTVNGVRHSWKSVELTINGKACAEITSVTYEDKS